MIIRARKGETTLVRREGRIVLDCDREWVVEGEASALDAVCAAAPEFAERLSPTLILLTFGNSIGRYRLGPVGEVELETGKWTATDFEGMLSDLSDVAAALPFSGRVGSGLPYGRVLLPERQVPFHAYVYLRYALSPTAPHHDRLDLAVRRVVAQTHQRLIAAKRIVPVEHASRIGPQGLLCAIASPWNWSKLPEGNPVARAMRGYLPLTVEEEERSHTVDTPENRFVLAVLGLAHDIIEKTKRHAETWRHVAYRNKLRADCDDLSQILAPLRGHALWRSVGPMTHFPASSTVLQRRYGYREVLRTFVRLRLVSRIPFDAEAIADLLALKDIATLYELWCFFDLVRAIETHIGAPYEAQAPDVAADEVSARWGLRVAWRDGTSLLYNAPFTQRSSRRSTSVFLRPDAALYLAAGPNAGLHLFDAKFRLQWVDQDDDDEDDRASTFKRDDLYKMHTYRDAIPDARSVWTMYPGSQLRFFRADGCKPDAYDGVGVIPARPGATTLHEVIGGLFGRRPAVV